MCFEVKITSTPPNEKRVTSEGQSLRAEKTASRCPSKEFQAAAPSLCSAKNQIDNWKTAGYHYQSFRLQMRSS